MPPRKKPRVVELEQPFKINELLQPHDEVRPKRLKGPTFKPPRTRVKKVPSPAPVSGPVDPKEAWVVFCVPLEVAKSMYGVTGHIAGGEKTYRPDFGGDFTGGAIVLRAALLQAGVKYPDRLWGRYKGVLWPANRDYRWNSALSDETEQEPET